MTETTDYFWDCECEANYIRPKEENYCSKCDSCNSEQPDSITSEVEYLLNDN